MPVEARVTELKTQKTKASVSAFPRAKSCLYLKRLSDLHQPTLRKLIAEPVRHMKQRHATAG